MGPLPTAGPYRLLLVSLFVMFKVNMWQGVSVMGFVCLGWTSKTGIGGYRLEVALGWEL